MKLRMTVAVLAVAGLLAAASPASAQVIVSSGYTPYAGSVVTSGTTYGIPGVGSVTVGGYNPYTTGYSMPYTNSSVMGSYYGGYSPYSGYSTWSGYSPYTSGYSMPYATGYSNYSYPAYSNNYGGYGRRGMFGRWR